MRVISKWRPAHFVPIVALVALFFRHAPRRVPFLEAEHSWLVKRGCDHFCLNEVANFEALFRAEQNQGFTEQEAREFHQRGVVHFRGAIQNRLLLERLSAYMWPVAATENGFYDHNACHIWNPAVRALKEHLQRVVVSVLPGVNRSKDIHCYDSPCFGHQEIDPEAEGQEAERYHFDEERQWNVWPSHNCLTMTFHVAMTDSSAPLKFVLDSHKVRGELLEVCAEWWNCVACRNGLGTTYAMLGQECVSGHIPSMRRPDVNLSIWKPDVQAGDILVIDGNVLHLAIQNSHRLSVAYRFVAPYYLPGAMTDYLLPIHYVPPGVTAIPDS